MAIVKNFWLQGSSKRLAGSVIYKAMGQTRQRALAESVSNPRTEAQMSQRVRWANLVNLYRANQSWMRYAYETKRTNQSEYNKWMSLNVSNSRIYLTKEMAALGACVVDAYVITQGSLPSIEVSNPDGHDYITNIFIGNLSDLTNVSVAQFSEQVLTNNPGIREGDQISLIRLSQQTNASSGAPYVIVRKYELVIDRTNNTRLYNYLPADLVLPLSSGEVSVLGINTDDLAGGFAWILSRTISGRTYVSTQSIIPVNNDTIINLYSSQAAYNAAIASYGSSAEAFLSTITANTAERAEIPPAILSIAVGGNTYAVGSRVEISSLGVDQTFDIILNQTIPEASGPILINTNQGVIQSALVGTAGATVQTEIDIPAQITDVVIYDITVQTSLGTARGQFAIRNQDSQGGME